MKEYLVNSETLIGNYARNGKNSFNQTRFFDYLKI